MKTRFIFSFFAALSLALLLTTGCVSQQQKASESIPVTGADRLQAQVEMSAGALWVNGGADSLVEAQFVYSRLFEQPQIDYELEADSGKLRITQPNAAYIGINERNEWHIDLNDTVPVALEVSLGAGEGDLKLGSLSLQRLDVNAGAGDLTIDLRGDWQQDLEASIEGGIGRLTVYLPQDVGVRVQAAQGMGRIDARGLEKDGSAFVNEQYGQADVLLDIHIEAGLGVISLIAES